MLARTSIATLLLLLALAAPAAAHHGQGSHAPPQDPPKEPDPCACDPPPGPTVVEIGDGFECLGGSSGMLTIDAVVVIVNLHYCKPSLVPIGP